ncbi:MAG: SGNH/GDSL hydrolase family protein [Nitrospinota bacterium]|nr:SGNH/GDSL hydrolase family protein [Nitrospinota bacterium]
MHTAKNALRYTAATGCVVYLVVTLYYIFVGPFDLRPHGVGVYVAGVDKPLLWLIALFALFLGLSPAGMFRRWAQRDRLGFLPGAARLAIALLLAIVAVAHALAFLTYGIIGKVILSTPMGQVPIDNGLKPGAFTLLGLLAAFIVLSAPARMRVMDRMWGWRFHLTLATLTMALGFAVGEIAVRIAAGSLPGVRYMVFVGEENRDVIFPDLETYLASKPDIKPFMPLLNYYDNSLGMRDTEFEVPKPDGRYRIMALGDSFTYGMVPYPDSVMTQVEEELKRSCGGKDLDVLNFGITGGDLWDYKTMYGLAERRYQPDMVVLHFYMGNDGPNIYYNSIQLPEKQKHPQAPVSYLLKYLGNMLTVVKSVETERLLNEWSEFGQQKRVEKACGGCPVTPGQVVTDESPELKSPYFVPTRWIFYISIIEVGVMYVQDPAEAEKQWEPAFEILDQIARQVEASGRKFALVMYPSSFQIYPQRIDEFMEGIGEVDKFIDDLHSPEDAERFKTIRREFIKTNHPNLMLSQFCQSRGLDCFDTTAPLLAAAAASEKPLYRKRETHWLIHGNHVAARAEARFLKELVCP